MNDLMGEQRAPTSETTKSQRWGRRILTGMVALAAMGGFAMIVVFSYDKGKENGAVAGTPVIKAQQGPTKIKPEKPGGMPIRDQDKGVYDRLDPNAKQEKVENLLPAPEPAMPKPAPMKLPEITKEDVAKAKAATPAAGSNIVAPPPPPPLVAALNNGYRIQIASLKSEAAANAAWRKLQKNHPSLFGRLKSNIVRAVIPGKGTYYRLQAGTIKGQSAARALCSQAKKRKIGCLIVKPR
jgi:hypothetical protein